MGHAGIPPKKNLKKLENMSLGGIIPLQRFCKCGQVPTVVLHWVHQWVCQDPEIIHFDTGEMMA